MLDPRVTKLAELLVNHSIELNRDDKVLIHAFDIPDEVVAEMARVCHAKGAQVAVRLESNLVRRRGERESIRLTFESDIKRYQELRAIRPR